MQQNRQGGGNRGGGGNQPPQQGGGGNAPQREPDWASLYSDLANAADGVMAFPDRVLNMTSAKNQLIAALAVVEKTLGIQGSTVTNANADDRVGNAVYRLATWESQEDQEEDNGGGQPVRPTAPTRPRGPAGGTPARPTTAPGGGPKKKGFLDDLRDELKKRF